MNYKKAIASIPRLCLTDAYKAGHFEQYPQGNQLMEAYIEARTPYDGDTTDSRILHMGSQYFIDMYMADPITSQDIDEAVEFYATFNVGRTPYPFPEELLREVVAEYDGVLPFTVRALEEGRAIHARTPQLTITAEGKFAPLVTWFETLALQCVWYMSTVATNSRRIKDTVQAFFHKYVDEEAHFLIESRLHDFGYRGCTSGEQAIMGGLAHLVNFEGTDTLPAAAAARAMSRSGEHQACSIPATEHSVMTSWDSEQNALRNMIGKNGAGLYATVADSYDYAEYLKTVNRNHDLIEEAGGMCVVRPDSGDPVAQIVKALVSFKGGFVARQNKAIQQNYQQDVDLPVPVLFREKKSGLAYFKHLAAIQGDGIDAAMVQKILLAVVDAGFSPRCVAFGMGSGLLQKVNRDTCAYAMKLCYATLPDGTPFEIMKKPVQKPGEMNKSSMPGLLTVEPSPGLFPPVVHTTTIQDREDTHNLLVEVYNPVDGALPNDTYWEDIRELATRTWEGMRPTTPSYLDYPGHWDQSLIAKSRTWAPPTSNS